jgi:hypothetical protein
MQRREFLTVTAGAGMTGLAGCVSVLGDLGKQRPPPLPENRPKAVYYPSHVDGVKIAGISQQGGYTCALTYSRPQRLWIYSAGQREKATVQPDDSIHLMPIIWETETRVVIPYLIPQIKIRQGNETIEYFSPWPMLTQPMGFHFGDNVELPGEGTYRVIIEFAGIESAGPAIRRMKAFADNRSARFEFPFEFSQAKLNETTYRDIPQAKEGTKGAVEPMNMKGILPLQLPKVDSLPGTVLGTATSGDAVFVVTALNAAQIGGSRNQTYLAVSARTPYNRYMVPLMSLSAHLTRDGKSIFNGSLTEGLDNELHYHYGAFVPSVKPDDELKITVDATSKASRHEGYETAFYEMPPMQLTLST